MDIPRKKMENNFFRRKQVILKKNDLSRKGSVDILIWNLVKSLNDHESFFTTSSCSGRIVLLSDTSLTKDDAGAPLSKKKGCQWFFVSHESVDCEDVINALASVTEESKLKFEPFIIHVQCATLCSAEELLKIAISSGFRNSGITTGKKGKNIMVAVRATLSLEVPLTSASGCRLTSDEYVQYITQIANAKLLNNEKLIKRFETNLKNIYTAKVFDFKTEANSLRVARNKKVQEPKENGKQESNDYVVDDICSLFV